MQIHIFCFLLSLYSCSVLASLLEPVVEKVVHLQTSHPPSGAPGIWKKKLIWKARWVQEWKSAKTWKPVWRKVWSPVEIREWVPIPRPPPQIIKDVSPHPPPDSVEPSPIYPPLKPEPSTPLLPIADRPSVAWPNTDMQDLLSSYHTIKDVDDGGYQYPKPSDLQNGQNSDYQAPNTETFGQFLEPPKDTGAFGRFSNPKLVQPSADLQSPQKSDPKDYPIKPISPYAAKLAQAVLREKFNKSLNPTERPSGLTDVIYKPNPTSTTPKPTPARVVKSTGQSTTDNPSNLYIVTPVSFV